MRLVGEPARLSSRGLLAQLAGKAIQVVEEALPVALKIVAVVLQPVVRRRFEIEIVIAQIFTL